MTELGHHNVHLPVPAHGSMGVVGAWVSFVVPRTAVTIHEATVRERCLDITTVKKGKSKKTMCGYPEKYLLLWTLHLHMDWGIEYHINCNRHHYGHLTQFNFDSVKPKFFWTKRTFYFLRDILNNTFSFSPVVFQSKARSKGSRRETPEGIQGTAAEGCTPAACRPGSHSEPVIGHADCTHSSPHCGSCSCQRMC